MKKNVAGQRIQVKLLDTEGAPVTTGTTNVAVEIDGVPGTGGTATHISGGKWEYLPIQGDTNGDHVSFEFTNAGAVDVLLQVYTGFPQAGDSYLGTVAHGNIANQYNGTGLVGDTFPSTQSQVGNIGSATGGGFSFEAIGDNTGGAIKGISFVGVETSGAYIDTEANDGIYHQIDDTGNTIDIIYQFNIGSDRVATEITFKGYLSGNNDTALIQAYDFIGSSWETRETIVGQNGSSNITITPKLLSKHTGIGSDSGLVLIRILASAQSNPALFTDEFLVQANALATGIPNGSTITLDAATVNETFIGYAWNLVLNGQTISGSYFANAISISGTGVIANGSPAILSGSKIETCTLDAYFIAGRCILSDTLTMVSTSGGVDDEVDLFNCASGVKGVGSPIIDASGVTKTTGIQNRLYGGGCTYSINSFCTLSHESIVSGTITLTNVGGTAELRGNAKAFVVTSSGAATTNIVCTSGVPITINGTGGTVNIYGVHAGITDNSSGTVTINDNGADITDKSDYSLSSTGLDAISQAATGMIEIAKAVLDRVVTEGNHNIQNSVGKIIRELKEIAGYEGGFIYYNSVGGAAGNEAFINGTLENAVNNETDLLILKAALNMDQVKIKPGSILTLTASHEKQEYIGEAWTLNLGNQSISASFFHGATSVNGMCTGAIQPKFCDCTIGNITVPPSSYHKCGFSGDFIAGLAGDFFFVGDSHSAIAGTGTPSFDYGAAIGATNFNFRGYHGGMEIENMKTGDNLSFDGDGQIVINANCTGGTIRIAGHQKITGAAAFIAAGGVIEDDARFATDQIKQVNVISPDNGGLNLPYGTEGLPERIVKGDHISFVRTLTGDWTAKRLFFAMKLEDSEAFVLGDDKDGAGEIEITGHTYDSDTDLTSLTVSLTTTQSAVAVDTYKAEIEAREADGSDPSTPLKFGLEVIIGLIN